MNDWNAIRWNNELVSPAGSKRLEPLSCSGQGDGDTMLEWDACNMAERLLIDLKLCRRVP